MSGRDFLCIAMRFVLIITLFLLPATVHGQGIGSILDKSTNPGEVLVEFDNRAIDLKGSYYLFKDWERGGLQLFSNASVKDQWMNFNLENDMLEVKLEEEIKVVPLNRILKFEILRDSLRSEIYKSCDGFVQEGDIPLAGLCQIIDTNFFGYIQRFTFDIQESTYVPALDMGKKDREIIIKTKYFLTIGRMAYPLPMNKKMLMELYAPYVTDLEVFMSQNKLSPRKVGDLARILDFLNSKDDP